MMMILNQSKNTTTDKMMMKMRNVAQNQLHEEQRKLSLAQIIIMARSEQVSGLHLNTHVHPTHVAFE